MVEISNLSKTYTARHKSKQALRDINIVLPDIGLVCLVGKSGCGKTTLLNMLGALDMPTGGDIRVDGKSIISASESERNSYRAVGVGFIFQELNLIEGLTVRDNLRLVCDKKDLDEKYAELLHKLEIDEFADKLPQELSGGQRQRVAIARAIVKGSKILLCDEPTGSLDPENAVMIFETLKEISKERLVVVVSHDVDTAILYADRTVRMHDGVVAGDTQEDGTRGEQAQEKSAQAAPAVAAKPAARPKAGQRARALFGLSARYLKYKRGRFVIMSVISVLMFTVLALVSTMTSYSRIPMTASTMKENDIDYIAVTRDLNARLGTDSKHEYSITDVPLSDISVQEMSDRLRCHVDPVYNFMPRSSRKKKGIPYGNLGKEEEQIDPSILNPYLYTTQAIGFVQISPEFLSRYGYSVVGELPRTASEVALGGIGLQTYRVFGYKDGEEIVPIRTAADMVGRQIEIMGEMLTVTGVVDTHFDVKRYDPTLMANSRKEENRLRAREREYEEMEIGMHNVLFVNEAYIVAQKSAYVLQKEKVSELSVNNVINAVTVEVQSGAEIYYANGFDATSDVFLLDKKQISPNFESLLYRRVCDYASENWERVRETFEKSDAVDDDYKQYGSWKGYFQYIYYSGTDNAIEPGITKHYFETIIWQELADAYARDCPTLSIKAGYSPYYTSSVPFGGIVVRNGDTFILSGSVYYQNNAWNNVIDSFVAQLQQSANDFDSYISKAMIPVKSKREAKRLLRHTNKVFDRTDSDPLYAALQSNNQIFGTTYVLSNEAVCAVDRAHNTLTSVAEILQYVLLGMSLLTVLIIIMYFAALLGNREKDVGVLRTNGYTKWEVALLFIFESLIVSALFIVLSILVSGILTVVANATVKKQYGLLLSPLRYTIRQVGLIVGFQLLFSAVGILIPLLLLLRKKPMAIINAGK